MSTGFTIWKPAMYSTFPLAFYGRCRLCIPATSQVDIARAPEGRCDGAGTPDRTRTCNRRLRRPVLYPIELRAR